MPSPMQQREENIAKLVDAYKNGNHLPRVETLRNTAQDMFPILTEETIRDYARTAHRVLKAKKKQQQEETG